MIKEFPTGSHNYVFEEHQRDPARPHLLMLHGFMGDRRVFEHLINELCSFCNPVTVDLLGHGSSTKTMDDRPYRAENQAGDIHKLIKTLDISPLFLYGYSMGGRLALHTTLSKPNLFTGVILESTTCGITEPKEADQRSSRDYQRSEEIERDFASFLARWKELDLFQSPKGIDQKLSEKYHKIQSEQSPEGLSASLRGFGTGVMPPVCDELKTFTKPVLLLAGSADEKYQHIKRLMADQFPNAIFHSIKAGHRIHLDNPDKLISKIEPFIKTHLP